MSGGNRGQGNLIHCSGKEIYSGFTEEDDADNDDEYDDTKNVKIGFSRGKLEAGRNALGLCTARY